MTLQAVKIWKTWKNLVIDLKRSSEISGVKMDFFLKNLIPQTRRKVSVYDGFIWGLKPE